MYFGRIGKSLTISFEVESVCRDGENITSSLTPFEIREIMYFAEREVFCKALGSSNGDFEMAISIDDSKYSLRVLFIKEYGITDKPSGSDLSKVICLGFEVDDVMKRDNESLVRVTNRMAANEKDLILEDFERKVIVNGEHSTSGNIFLVSMIDNYEYTARGRFFSKYTAC